jgi:hypothetical protein
MLKMAHMKARHVGLKTKQKLKWKFMIQSFFNYYPITVSCSKPDPTTSSFLQHVTSCCPIEQIDLCRKCFCSSEQTWTYTKMEIKQTACQLKSWKLLWRRLSISWFFRLAANRFVALETRAFCDVAPCTLVGVYRRFSNASCLHHQGGDSSTHLWNVGILQRDYTALYPRRLSSSYSPPWEPNILQISS